MLISFEGYVEKKKFKKKTVLCQIIRTVHGNDFILCIFIYFDFYVIGLLHSEPDSTGRSMVFGTGKRILDILMLSTNFLLPNKMYFILPD